MSFIRGWDGAAWEGRVRRFHPAEQVKSFKGRQHVPPLFLTQDQDSENPEVYPRLDLTEHVFQKVWKKNDQETTHSKMENSSSSLVRKKWNSSGSQVRILQPFWLNWKPSPKITLHGWWSCDLLGALTFYIITF